MGFPNGAHPCTLVVFGQVSETFSCHILFTRLWRPWNQDVVSSRNLTRAEPRFRTIDTWSSPQKDLILTLWYLCQNFRCHVVAFIEIERLRIATHCYATSFLRKLILCETNSFFYSREYWSWQNYRLYKIFQPTTFRLNILHSFTIHLAVVISENKKHFYEAQNKGLSKLSVEKKFGN